jgi:hypothetical protein
MYRNVYIRNIFNTYYNYISVTHELSGVVQNLHFMGNFKDFRQNCRSHTTSYNLNTTLSISFATIQPLPLYMRESALTLKSLEFYYKGVLVLLYVRVGYRKTRD